MWSNVRWPLVTGLWRSKSTKTMDAEERHHFPRGCNRIGWKWVYMIVDINSKLDLLALDREINKFKGVNQKKPYLFVNIETAKAIEKEILPSWAYNLGKTTDTVVVGSKEGTFKNGMICEYGSYKVFINEDLKFGEVELR